MNVILYSFFCCTFIAVGAASCPGQFQASDVDYQHVAEVTDWTFQDDAASAEWCIQSLGETGY